MARTIVRTLLAPAAAAILVAGAGACSFSFGSSHSVSKSDVANQISTKMTDAAGNKPSSVTCPNDLDAKVGAQLNCSMQVKDQSYGVNVTVTSVNGNDVKFDMVEMVDKGKVAEQISAKMTDAAGNKPDTVTCPSDLLAKVGTQLICETQVSGTTNHVNVTVTSVNGSDVKFDMVETVDKSQIAEQISAKMTDAAGNKPDAVTCPSDLPGKVGAQLNCDMKVKGTSYTMNVTVTSVNGSGVFFDIAETVDKNQIASKVSDKLTQQVGRKPDSVTCPENLKGVEGATLRCELTDGNQRYGVNLTVTGVDAGTVDFNIQVDDQPS